MIVVETIAKVRRDYFVHKKGIKQICRDRGISRNSVRKILRSKVTEFRYDRSAQPLPKLGLFTEPLDVMLKANERCSRKERLTLTRIHDDLRRVGYLPKKRVTTAADGSATIVNGKAKVSQKAEQNVATFGLA